MAALGVFGSAVAYTLFYVLLGDFRASQLAVLQWVTPVVGVVEAALWLRHLPSWEKTGSAALIIACAVLLLRLPNDDIGATSERMSPLTLKITPL